MATITIQSLITLRKATKRRSSKKRRTKLKTRRLKHSILVASDTKISTNWRVFSRTSFVEALTTFHLRKANKNWCESCCNTTTKEPRRSRTWSTLSLMFTQSTLTLGVCLQLKTTTVGKTSVSLSVSAGLRISSLHDFMFYLKRDTFWCIFIDNWIIWIL